MDILDFIETFLGSLNNDMGKLIVSVLFMSFLGVGLGLIGLPKLSILMIVVVTLFMFVAFGWFPIWIIILIAILLFGLLYINIFGGKSNA